MDHRQKHLVGVTLILISTVAWSVTGYFTRLVALDTVTLITWRGIFGAVCLVIVAVLLRGRAWRTEFMIFGRLQLIYIANSTVTTLMLFTAFAYTSVAHVVVIFAALPIVAAIMGWWILREIPSGSSMIASVVAVGGVSVMVAVGTDGGLLGDLLAVGMTVCVTFTIILNRQNPSLPVIGCSAVSLAATSLLCWPFAAHGAVTGLQFVQVGLFAFVNSIFGVALYALGSRRIPAVEVAVISALDMPLAVFWVWLAFNERPGVHTIAGGIAVVVAVLFHIVATARRRKPIVAAHP